MPGSQFESAFFFRVHELALSDDVTFAYFFTFACFFVINNANDSLIWRKWLETWKRNDDMDFGQSSEFCLEAWKNSFKIRYLIYEFTNCFLWRSVRQWVRCWPNTKNKDIFMLLTDEALMCYGYRALSLYLHILCKSSWSLIVACKNGMIHFVLWSPLNEYLCKNGR